jgi:hypothetical protein
VILNGVNELCPNFTCFSSVGGVRVVGYLIGDPNSLRSFISNPSMGSKQPNSYHYPLFFMKCHIIGSRLPTSSSQCQVLRPKTKEANLYVLKVKHDPFIVCKVSATLNQ